MEPARNIGCDLKIPNGSAGDRLILGDDFVPMGMAIVTSLIAADDPFHPLLPEKGSCLRPPQITSEKDVFFGSLRLRIVSSSDRPNLGQAALVGPSIDQESLPVG
jgi:hypothetical protein